MRVLITGATGFAGKHLTQYLTSKSPDNYKIYGTHRHSYLKEETNVIELVECDINDSISLESTLQSIEPDQIFHFAAYVSVNKSFENPQKVLATNVIGTAKLLEAIRKTCNNAKILIPGSAEEYGSVEEKNMPIDENVPLNPSNPYGISKVSQELLGKYYFQTYGMEIYLTRTFHYTGPFQPLGFVSSDFAKQIVDIENGKKNQINVGNLKAKRDFLDIRDVVKAYMNIIERGKPGRPYNVCSGKTISIEKILEILKNHSKCPINVQVDKSKLRATDVSKFVGDNSKLKKDTGWEPEIKIEDTLHDILNYWRKHI